SYKISKRWRFGCSVRSNRRLPELQKGAHLTTPESKNPTDLKPRHDRGRGARLRKRFFRQHRSDCVEKLGPGAPTKFFWVMDARSERGRGGPRRLALTRRGSF